jgi:uncharacterized protein (DUF58 family)
VIFPTARAIYTAVAGAPVALLLATLAPQAWPLGLAWIVILAALLLIDAVLGADRHALDWHLTAPLTVEVGETAEIEISLNFHRGPAPSSATVRLETNAFLRPRFWLWRSRRAGNQILIVAQLDALRRGAGELQRIWLEWRGPLGLITKRRILDTQRPITIAPNLKSLHAQALKIFALGTISGSRDFNRKGQGSEFEALREFLPGMDRRMIDWKQSARHTKLLAREFRAEQDQTIMLAIDTGRLMCEPVAGMPKIDHAIAAAMLLSYVGLKMGDRVGMFAFDSRPRFSSAPSSGVGAFPALQRLASQLDYSTEETNFTLGLSKLSADVRRRSLVVVFTDFADPTSAELMIENIGRLASKHLVLFVAIRDQELDDLTMKEPQHMLDATRSVIAHSLLLEREVVLTRLQRLGVHLIDAPAASLGPDLLNRYLDIKHASQL